MAGSAGKIEILRQAELWDVKTATKGKAVRSDDGESVKSITPHSP